MLKLHHLNLLNEIHETALMLNLFEQRQLIREQKLVKMRQLQNLLPNNNNHNNDQRENVISGPQQQQQQQPYNNSTGSIKVSDDEHDTTDHPNWNQENHMASNKKRPMDDYLVSKKKQK